MSTTAKSHKTRKTGAAAGRPRNTRGDASGTGDASGPSSEGVIALTAPQSASAPPLQNPLEAILAPHGGEQGGRQGEGENGPPAATGVPTERPEDQWWFRSPDSKTRPVAAKIMVMRAAGHKSDTIAKKLGMTENSVRNTVYIARKNGWIDDNDETVDLEADLALTVERKIVRNISASLDGGMTNWQTHEMTIAAAKGRGIFKNHDKVEGGQQHLAVVAIQVVMPPVGVGDQGVDESALGGMPAYVEGELADEG